MHHKGSLTCLPETGGRLTRASLFVLSCVMKPASIGILTWHAGGVSVSNGQTSPGGLW